MVCWVSVPQDAGRVPAASAVPAPRRRRLKTRPSVPPRNQVLRARCGASSVAVASVGTSHVSSVSWRMRALRSSRRAAMVW